MRNARFWKYHLINNILIVDDSSQLIVEFKDLENIKVRCQYYNYLPFHHPKEDS